MNRNNNLNKYNLDPKWVKCGGCSKPAQLRREEGSFVISAYRGRNNEELCHKCASCYHCGKKEKWDIYRKIGYKAEYEWKVEEDYGMPSYHLVDKENPSGGWEVAFCLDCRDKKGHETFRYYDDREYWKVDGKIFNPETKREWNNFENFKRAYEKAQDYWNSLSSSEREREGERLIENMKLGKYWGGLRGKEGEMFGWVPNQSWWQIKNGKLVSWEPQKVPCLIAEEFVQKMFGDNNLSNELVLRDYRVVKKDNNDNKVNYPSPNPAIPNSQPITNSSEKKDKSDNSVKENPGNSPQASSPEKSDYSFEIKLNPSADNQKDSFQTKPNEAKKENNNKVLVVNLKDIKKISLVGDNLVIEFNQSEEVQTVVSEQISSSQELSAAKNYLQTNHRSSMDSQELANVISQQKNKGANSSPTQPSKSPFLWIAGVGVIGVMAGLCVGLVVRVKKLRPKKK